MGQINSTGGTHTFPAAQKSAAITKTNESKPNGLLSRSRAILAFALLLSLQLFTGKANATVLPTTGFSCSISKTATSSCVSGYYATFGTSSTNYWLYTVSTSGYSSIQMSFKTSKSSTGPSTALVYYNIGGGDVLFTSYSVTTSCVTKNIALPAACDNQPSVSIKLKMSGGTNSGGTNRVDADGGFTGTASSFCSGTPSAGTVSASESAFCGSGSPLLTLTPGSTGSDLTYQWYDGSGLIVGATNLTYTPTVTSTSTYSVITTCPTGPFSSTDATSTITINTIPTVSAISAVPTPVLLVGATATLTNATSGGVWTSSVPSKGTIDAITGDITGISGGTTLVSYIVDNGTCSNAATATVNIVWPNTLGLYVGHDGTSTDVIAIADETASSLTATGFGSNSPCTTGGISGLTVSTTVATYSSSNPHVSYILTPDAGHALNVFELHVSTRSSGSGATKGRLAYRIGGGSWIDEGVDHTLATTGSCGANSNTWYWTLPAAENGITSNIEVAFFPYAPTSNTGTVQVQLLETIGVVSSDVLCSGTPLAGVITPSVTTVCESGYASMSFTGDAGVGISYVWEENVNGLGYAPIAGASSTYYVSPVYSVVGTTIEYRVRTTCSNGGADNTSAVSNFDVTTVPTAITGIPSYVEVGASPVTLGSTPSGGSWYTQNPNLASIDIATGDLTGILAGSTVVTYRTAGFGCFTTSVVTVDFPNTIAIYVGNSGSSTTVTDIASNITSSALAAGGAAFGSATPCTTGGLSGLTVNTVYATYVSTVNPYVGFTITPTSGYSISVSNIHASLRSSGTGPQLVRLAYSLDGGTSWTDGGEEFMDISSCGASTVDINFPASFTTTTNVLVAAFPYGATSGTGVFQVNAIDVTGDVCAPNGNIMNDDLSIVLDGGTYNAVICGPYQLSCTPAGGSWSSSNAAAGSVDASGILTFNSAAVSEVLTVQYTNLCGVVATATVNVTDAAGFGCDGSPRPSAPHTATVTEATGISVYPNPTTAVLNITGEGVASVSILSMDGKVLINQNNAKSINVNNLASGIYMVKVYNEKNNLVKTVKFTKN